MRASTAQKRPTSALGRPNQARTGRRRYFDPQLGVNLGACREKAKFGRFERKLLEQAVDADCLSRETA